MKHDNTIRDAIDESLGSVYFTHHDIHAVLQQTRGSRAPRKSATHRKSRFRPALAAAVVLLLFAPMTLLILRIRGNPTIDIKTITNVNPDAQITTVTTEGISSGAAPVLAALSESDAIQIARACFEEHADTSVFTFEEYTVSVAYDEAASQYLVTLTCIYDNGCSFGVTVSGASGEIISFTDPAAATIPTHIRTNSAEVQAWYDKYGEYIFAWPLETQAEFSRRYEGAQLRMPRAGEKDEEFIMKQAFRFHDMLAGESSHSGSLYPMLCDGKAFADGQARYLIYVFAFDSSDQPLDTYLLVTMLAASGEIESSQLLPISHLQ